MNKTLESLKKLVGTEFDRDEIIIAFGDTNGVDVIVNSSGDNGHDCIAYLDEYDSDQYIFSIDANNVITDVWLA